jgi:chromosome segregation ATPase
LVCVTGSVARRAESTVVDRSARTWPDLHESEGEWVETLELAVHAAERVRLTEQRNAQLEAWVRDLEARLGAELAALQARIRTAEETIERVEAARLAAEERARKSKERADEAEMFLARISAAIRPLAR